MLSVPGSPEPERRNLANVDHVDNVDTVRLSDREAEVLDLVVSGLTNAAAARRLGISERTVREHIARIFLKLRVNSRVEAAVIATEWRLAKEYAGQNPPRLSIA